MTHKQYNEILGNISTTWTCPLCPQQPKKECEIGSEFNFLSFLLYPSISDESFTGETSTTSPAVPSSSLSVEDEIHESCLTNIVHILEVGSAKDLRVAHMNLCSLQNKIEELRCLQRLCRFEILAITETQLDESISGDAVDRKGRKWGGCILLVLRRLFGRDASTRFVC